MVDLQFDRVAKLYSRVRPTYPRRVFELLLEALPCKYFDVAVDIGCGAGQSLVGLLPIAKKVIGVEPAEKLRAEAQAAFPALEILAGTGEDTGLPPASADLITVATAFYWMDKVKALGEANRVLCSRGVFATYKYDFPKPLSPMASIIEAHLARHWDAHRSKRLTEFDDTADLMRQSGFFKAVNSTIVPYSIEYDAAGFVEFMSSTSYVSAFLRTLERSQEYIDELIQELRGVEPGRFQVSFDIFMNIGTKQS